MPTLRFEIETDSSFDADELGELQEQFSDWISELDGSAEVDTADVRIVASAGTAEKTLLENAGLVGTVTLQAEDGTILKKIQFSELSEV